MNNTRDPSTADPAKAADATPTSLHAPPGSPAVRVHSGPDTATVADPPTRAHTTPGLSHPDEKTTTRPSSDIR
ncbi:MAG TPA: hypothetical protein VFY45_20490, partial [Baekduia sp.]|nr:hypothetical protein [Baekduia sp.]